MAEQSTVKPITQQELDVFGVSLVMVARVGDKTFSSSVSPVDYSIFKKELYRDKLYADLIKRIDYDLAASVADPTPLTEEKFFIKKEVEVEL